MILPLAIIWGVGKAPGLGYSLAKVFSKTHAVAIVSRSVDKLEPIADELRSQGADVRAFGAQATADGVADAFAQIQQTFGADRQVALGVWNAATRPAPKSLLDVTDAELDESGQVNLRAPAAFARALLPLVLRNPLDGSKPRGALLFTGATASLKGSNGFAAFASGKFALRALAQSAAREFGPQGVHVGHVIVDGLIDFEPEVAKTTKIHPDSLAGAYRFLAEQDRTSFTLELDLRPGEEKF